MFIYHLPPACSTDDLADSCLQFTPAQKWGSHVIGDLLCSTKSVLVGLGINTGRAKQSREHRSVLSWCWTQRGQVSPVQHRVSLVPCGCCRAQGTGLCWHSVLWVSWTLAALCGALLCKAHRPTQFIAARPGARTTSRPPPRTPL